MPTLTNKKCAEEILKFIEQYCPYGSSNRGDAWNVAGKITAIRNGQDKALDWMKLDNKQAAFWTEQELKGAKTAIATDIECQQSPLSANRHVYSFNDVKEIAKGAILYGNGRCTHLACVGLVYSQEIAPEICVVAMHFSQTKTKKMFGHTLLLIGMKQIESQFRPTEDTYFCDPWTMRMGNLHEYVEYIQSPELNYAPFSGIVAKAWLPDGSVSPVCRLTNTWVESEERKANIEKIEATYNQFIEKNKELVHQRRKTLYSLVMHSQPELEKALRNAAANNQVDDLHYFLKKVCNINAVDQGVNQRTALHWACLKGHVACVAALLDAGANPQLEDATRKSPKDLASSKEILSLFERGDTLNNSLCM